MQLWSVGLSESFKYHKKLTIIVRALLIGETPKWQGVVFLLSLEMVKCTQLKWRQENDGLSTPGASKSCNEFGVINWLESSNIVAYTITSHPPQPYRFKSTSLRFQIPDLRLSQFLSRYRFFRDMAGSDTWKAIVKMQHNVRTWARRTIWGDRVTLTRSWMWYGCGWRLG